MGAAAVVVTLGRSLRRQPHGSGSNAQLSVAAWTAAPSAVWRVDGERLYNRGTGGYLNARAGGVLRGHGNTGPPWSVASAETGPSSEMSLP